MINVNFNMILSVTIIAFLLFMIGHHVFRKLNLEGFEEAAEPKVGDTTVSDTKVADPKVSDPTVSEQKIADPMVSDTKVSDTKVSDTKIADPTVSDTKVSDTKIADPTVSEPKVSEPKIADPIVAQDDTSETDKSTMMTDLFESVNKQMDIIRTLKLSENMIPIKIDKTVPESQLILANLKLLINNGVYKNELDLKETYDKYIGNKAVQLLASDINSLNLESAEPHMETTYLTRTKSVVDGHQKIIDKILENKSKE